MPPPEPRQAAAKNAAAKNAAKPQGDSGSSEAVLQECEALEAELAALRNAYEQYFLGNERQAPSRAHEDFKKRLMKLKGAFIRSTSAKFRVAGLHNKFLTYERLWVRTLQEIESGTYRRDLFKARRRAESRKASSPGKDAQKGVVELPEDISDMDFEEVEELVRPRPANEPPLAGAGAPAAGGTPFRGTPAVAPVPGIPAVAPVAPAVAPLTPPAAGTPPRGTPAVAPLTGVPPVAPAVPSVAPVAGTPPRGLPTVTPPLAGTPARGAPAVPPGMAAKPAATPAPGAVPPVRPPVAPGAAARTPAPPAAAPPRPPAAAGGGMSDDKLRAVYDAYVTAKRRCQEDTSKLTFESVAATLRKQVPELLKQHNAKAVEFKVVIKDGKASLKAVPK
jgi:hypothetical protein